MSFEKSVVYQIYPKSFRDTTGNGRGDLRGVIEKLDYINELGVDYIWLTPIYPSPMNDNGYDVADYTSINPDFGSMEDFELLVAEAERRGISIMLDMVFNHTSTEHEWFKRALAGEKKYQDYYIFKDPVDGKAPTNWVSKFGGSAWEYVEDMGKYYLHLFDVTQADLNWENPEVREEIYAAANFWLEKGVKGFRLDVINLISKPDIYEDDTIGDGRRFYTDGPRIHEYLKELNERTFGRYEEVVTVGEMSSTSIENCIRYSNPYEKELSMTFSFHHLKVDYENGDKWSLKDFDFKELKKLLNRWQTEMDRGGGWNALFWCNHDQPRVVSRFGDDVNYRSESAKMLATSVHMMKGTPYIYQGEELSMTNAKYGSIDNYRDVESLNYYEILKGEGRPQDEILKILGEKSRDNSRTPMQWDDTVNGGFTSGEPWLATTENYREINSSRALEDRDSVFYHYKKLISLRREYDVISHGTFEPFMEEDEGIFAFKRRLEDEEVVVINNFYPVKREVEIERIGEYEVLTSNYKDIHLEEEQLHLREYESIVLYKKNS
ncbi:alpha,alpha-phosphotrehalase [Propionigenium maris DSM 9537]|uniref:Alpha,alpha-phosphotrehalase n=1 Tax=Propionigenium maris DSM 9537 TaxID=1123000 RepID=A0A9W6LM23_9FUSO|nr:alpha,alpha-phosphotrehalase [Propionigenium maris]GLI55232.1 alpha,alpha-phosphotrehalase [Propionigenium maris DSM 9537]